MSGLGGRCRTGERESLLDFFRVTDRERDLRFLLPRVEPPSRRALLKDGLRLRE